jgi:hypothetical protein
MQGYANKNFQTENKKLVSSAELVLVPLLKATGTKVTVGLITACSHLACSSFTTSQPLIPGN